MAAKLLGAGGLLPPALAILARLVIGPTAPVGELIVRIAIVYVILILSFLGGIWWGFGVTRAPEAKQAKLLILAVAPAIVGLALIALGVALPLLSTVLLAIAVAMTPLADAWLDGLGMAPPWWMRLRATLSSALAVLTLGLAALIAL